MTERNHATVRRLSAIILFVLLVLLAANLLRLRPAPINPLVQELAPGAEPAIVRALGDRGLDRISQVISYGDKSNWYSAGTHCSSGRWPDGRRYGLAFDIVIEPWDDANSDARALRLQGIAAWHRGHGAPGGPAGMGPHIHCVWPGAPSTNPQNAQQISSFVYGWRGLADRSRPFSMRRDPSIRHDEIACVRRAYERIHGRGSLALVTPYDDLHRGAAE